MADRDDPRAESGSAEVRTVATFNVVGFGLLGVLVGHASGALADVLPGIGTLAGIAAFGYLWALGLVSTRWAFAAGGLRRSREGELARLLARGTAGGALIGAGFVAGVVIAVTLADLLSGTLAVVPSGFALVIGGAAGGIVGAAVGFGFALVDVGLYRLSWVLVPDGE